MNKLAIFALLVICGAVVADDCTPLTSSSACGANTACTFTATTGSTCVNKCSILNATDCAANTTNCTPTPAACSASTACLATATDAAACTGSGSGSFCTFTAATGTCDFTNDLTTTCGDHGTNQADCTAEAGCTFTTTCIVDTTHCAANSGNTACNHTDVCTFTKTADSTCTNPSATGDCSPLTDNTTCAAKAGCVWTAFSCANTASYLCTAGLSETDCTATSKFCTYDATGTCATTTSTTYGAYLTAAGSILAAAILI